MCLLLLIIGFGAYYIFHSKEYLIKGTWIEEIDLTREVENSINGYLSEALFSDEISVNEYLEEEDFDKIWEAFDKNRIVLRYEQAEDNIPEDDDLSIFTPGNLRGKILSLS